MNMPSSGNRDLDQLANLQRERQAAMRTEARTDYLLRAERSEPSSIARRREGRAMLKRKLVLAVAAGALIALAIAQAVGAAAAGGGGGGTAFLAM